MEESQITTLGSGTKVKVSVKLVGATGSIIAICRYGNTVSMA